jgi:hypothetical protein
MLDDFDLAGNRIDTPLPPPRRQRQDDVWSKLQLYVQNDARINLDVQKLQKQLEPFDEKTLSMKSLRSFVGFCVKGYQNKKGMQDPRMLDIVIDYMEILQLVFPTDTSAQPNYIINLSAAMMENIDFLLDDKKLFVENVKEYTKLLIK